MHLLTITPFYPTELDEANGCFVAEPLAVLASVGVTNSVIAVSPMYRGVMSTHSSAPLARWLRYFSIPGGSGLSSAGKFLFLSLLRHVRELNRNVPIQLIHAHSALPCGHAAMLLSREMNVPYVVSVHGLDAYFTRQVPGRPGEWCRRVSKAVFQSAERVLCISEHVRAQVLQGEPECRTTIVYNGADPVLFSPTDEEQRPSRIVSVGNLIPIKGHALLLRAIAAVVAQNPTLECDLVGAGPEESHLRTLLRDLGLGGRVHILGRLGRKEVADLLRRATLFALPSSYEGLGCVYLEAMSAALPAIGCRGQGIEEVIQHGSNGWLVDPGDLEQLTCAIATLLDDPRLSRRIGMQARTTILQALTVEHQAECLLRVYEECAV